MTSTNRTRKSGGLLQSMVTTALVLSCGGGRNDGTQKTDGGAPALAIVMPESPTYTNKTITIQVSVTPPPPPGFQVDLLRNGVPFARVSDPFTFRWDTSYDREGSYEIRSSTADSEAPALSAPITVVVDRTPPTIVTRTPVNGATNVAVRDPLEIVFSEPIAPGRVSDQALTLQLDGYLVTSNSSIGTDGKSIVAVIKNRDNLVLPGEMSASVATTVTDLAGNSVASNAAATWSVPLWVDLGSLPTSPSARLSMALDSGGHPIIAAGFPTFTISRHVNGTNWTNPWGSPQSPDETELRELSLAVDRNDNPLVAWATLAFWAARWTGSTWMTYPSPRLGARVMTTKAFAAFTRNDEALVGWDEFAPNDGTSNAYIARWAGGWSLYPARTDIEARILDHMDRPVGLSIDGSNALCRFTGSSWSSVPLPADFRVNTVAVNSADQVILGNINNTLSRITLAEAGDPVRNPAELAPRGQVTSVSTAVDSQDYLVVAWTDRVDSQKGTADSALRFARRKWASGSSNWNYDLGEIKAPGGPTAYISTARLLVDHDDVPVIAWVESLPSGPAGRVYVRRLNR